MGSCLIQDHTKGLTIGKDDQISNLYVLDREDIADSGTLQQQFAVCSNVVVDTHLWHNRLGHSSISKTDAIIDVLGLKQNKGSFHCEICPLAKQKILPFNPQNNICEIAFDLLHIDI